MENFEIPEKILQLFDKEKRGMLLDVGAGTGEQAEALMAKGFSVYCCDLNSNDFRFDKEKFHFVKVDLNRSFPYVNQTFDYILCTEVIEHIENPHFLIREFHRILKVDGKVIMSTPNILNINSRLRFLTEGFYELFREPWIEVKKLVENPLALHINPVSYIELEYILDENGFAINEICTNRIK